MCAPRESQSVSPKSGRNNVQALRDVRGSDGVALIVNVVTRVINVKSFSEMMS